MKSLVFVSAFAATLLTACGSAQSPNSATRSAERAAVSVAADAWAAAGQACLDVAGASGDAGPRVVADCKKGLTPAYDLIMGAAAAVDTNWSPAAACDLVQGVGLVAATVASLPSVDPTVKSGIADAQILATALSGTVCPADAGAE